MTPLLLFLPLVAIGRPASEAPLASVAATPSAHAVASDPLPWWETMRDEELNTLIARALAENGDLDAARARIAQARALAWQSLAPTLPLVSMEAQGNTAPFESLGFQFGGLPRGGASDDLPDLYYTGSAYLVARTQVDLGKSVTAWQAGLRDASATAEEADASAAQLAGQVAQTYFDLVAAEEQVRILEEQIDTNRALLTLADMRYQAGTGEALDVLQQKQQLAAATTRLMPARAQRLVLAQALQVLVGASPNTLSVSAHRTLPEVSDIPPLPDAETLLGDLPELRAAKERLQAARLKVWSARLAFLPTVGVNGQIGGQGIVITEEKTQSVWGLNATLSIPLFQGGRHLAALQAAEAAERAAAAQLRQLVLRTEQVVRNAESRSREFRAQLDAARGQSRTAEAALALARERYAAGLTQYPALLAAVSAAQSAQLNVLESHRQLVQAQVALLDGIGGAWTHALAHP